MSPQTQTLNCSINITCLSCSKSVSFSIELHNLSKYFSHVQIQHEFDFLLFIIFNGNFLTHMLLK